MVKLPEGEDENEWLAVNMVDFYNQINLLYGAITEFCSPQSCPEMKATDEFEYLWQDNENFKRPTKMPAPAYIEQLMTWVQSNIDNEAVLPSRIGMTPCDSKRKNYILIVSQACRSPSRSPRLFARFSSACTASTPIFTATTTQ